MSEPLRIPVVELRRAAEVLLEHVRNVEGDVIELDKDMFWVVPAEALYDVYQQPATLDVGQLSESWQSVAEIARDEKPALGYALVWLSDVLRAVGQAIVR